NDIHRLDIWRSWHHDRKAEDRPLTLAHLIHRIPRASGLHALVIGLGCIGLVTALYFAWLRVTNPTIVALSFLLVVLIVATVSTRSVAIATSLMAFLCFNYFFLPPVGTW